MRRSVSDGSRDGQLHFRASSTLAPQYQPRSDSFGPLPDPGQPPMTGAGAFLQNCCVNALSIITDPQTEQISVVARVRFQFRAVKSCQAARSLIQTFPFAAPRIESMKPLGKPWRSLYVVKTP